MPVEEKEITRLLLDAFPDVDPEVDIQLVDTVGDKDHYYLKIRSASFAGKSAVERHRLVVSALGGILKEKLHSISIETKIKT
ncbi:BolA/IbaG family iron-sulfur metabolism protein [Neorickettsia findlayensis]|uniref:BolA/IbaG family iron-sulfur metabolism protein n=1 Tax=Neorickettsia findlayensis TaxID=2686014 RepID=A0A6P1G966_9RICK|nr:BolA/IbaG family iron-sulfur metabolism protein [Neorickettsia findlayensis]QHD64996.1 BolA/IbaG family iron-sulfur metabolism protein [Neorickettsia findlayensis]